MALDSSLQSADTILIHLPSCSALQLFGAVQRTPFTSLSFSNRRAAGFGPDLFPFNLCGSIP